MKPFLKYGLLIGLGFILTSFYQYGLIEDNPEATQGFSLVGVIMWLVNTALFVVGLYLALTDRKKAQNGVLTLGQGFGTGALTTLIASAVVLVGLYIYTAFINTDNLLLLQDIAYNEIDKQGVSGPGAKMGEKFVGMATSPLGYSLLSTINKIIGGIILSLIVAAIVKREEPTYHGA